MNVHRLLIHHSQEWFLKRKKKKRVIPVSWVLTMSFTLSCNISSSRKPSWASGRSAFSRWPHANLAPSGPSWGHEEKTWQARRIRFQGFWKAAPGAHLKDDICLSDACLNGLLPNFSWHGQKAFPNLFPNKNQFRTLINKFPRWWYFMRLSRVKGVF